MTETHGLGALDKFLMKFSYTAKTRFILSFGYFSVLIVLVVNFLLLMYPLQNLGEQKEGLERLKNLNGIFEAIQMRIVHHEALNFSKDLEKFIDSTATWMQSNPDSRGSIEGFKAKARLIYSYMDLYDSSHDIAIRSAAVNGLYECFRDLSEQIGTLSSLIYNIDTGVGYLFQTYIHDLPVVQQTIASAALTRMDAKQPYNAELLSVGRQLRNNINLAVDNLSEWVDGDWKKTSQLLEAFIKDLKEYIDGRVTPDKVLLSSIHLNRNLHEMNSLSVETEKQKFNGILWKCILILLLGGSLVAALYLTRVIRHPLENLVHAAQELSNGNLSVRIPITTNDEVAAITSAFNTMGAYYENILKRAAGIIDQIFVTSTTISSYTKEFESNMNSQERIVRQITSHAASLQKGEEEFAQVLQKANEAASKTGMLAEMSHESLHGMETIIHKMLSASSNIVTTLSSLKDKLGDVHHVIFAIVKIADQSNLLSLNTAFRAAKSGNEGRGFVIIADKIREMAEQIALATLDIEKVVEDIVEAVKMTVQEVEGFAAKLITQVEDTSEVGSHLRNLIKFTQEQATDFEQINLGMQDQTKGIIAINQVIGELRVNVQESAFAVRKLYLEMEYLYESSNTLQDTVKQFHFDGG